MFCIKTYLLFLIDQFVNFDRTYYLIIHCKILIIVYIFRLDIKWVIFSIVSDDTMQSEKRIII